eukprot:GHVS01071490.1.p1 GENE.GHVS01071490.1~~GHVS01071490.1.p1  ORF type:complete len:1347 (+),score=270.50 GHVS01071490.1:285-4325(+)
MDSPRISSWDICAANASTTATIKTGPSETTSLFTTSATSDTTGSHTSTGGEDSTSNDTTMAAGRVTLMYLMYLKNIRLCHSTLFVEEGKTHTVKSTSRHTGGALRFSWSADDAVDTSQLCPLPSPSHGFAHSLRPRFVSFLAIRLAKHPYRPYEVLSKNIQLTVCDAVGTKLATGSMDLGQFLYSQPFLQLRVRLWNLRHQLCGACSKRWRCSPSGRLSFSREDFTEFIDTGRDPQAKFIYNAFTDSIAHQLAQQQPRKPVRRQKKESQDSARGDEEESEPPSEANDVMERAEAASSPAIGDQEVEDGASVDSPRSPFSSPFVGRSNSCPLPSSCAPPPLASCIRHENSSPDLAAAMNCSPHRLDTYAGGMEEGRQESHGESHGESQEGWEEEERAEEERAEEERAEEERAEEERAKEEQRQENHLLGNEDNLDTIPIMPTTHTIPIMPTTHTIPITRTASNRSITPNPGPVISAATYISPNHLPQVPPLSAFPSFSPTISSSPSFTQDLLAGLPGPLISSLPHLSSLLSSSPVHRPLMTPPPGSEYPEQHASFTSSCHPVFHQRPPPRMFPTNVPPLALPPPSPSSFLIPLRPLTTPCLLQAHSAESLAGSTSSTSSSSSPTSLSSVQFPPPRADTTSSTFDQFLPLHPSYPLRPLSPVGFLRPSSCGLVARPASFFPSSCPPPPPLFPPPSASQHTNPFSPSYQRRHSTAGFVSTPPSYTPSVSLPISPAPPPCTGRTLPLFPSSSPPVAFHLPASVESQMPPLGTRGATRQSTSSTSPHPTSSSCSPPSPLFHHFPVEQASPSRARDTLTHPLPVRRAEMRTPELRPKEMDAVERAVDQRDVWRKEDGATGWLSSRRGHEWGQFQSGQVEGQESNDELSNAAPMGTDRRQEVRCHKIARPLEVQTDRGKDEDGDCYPGTEMRDERTLVQEDLHEGENRRQRGWDEEEDAGWGRQRVWLDAGERTLDTAQQPESNAKEGSQQWNRDVSGASRGRANICGSGGRSPLHVKDDEGWQEEGGRRRQLDPLGTELSEAPDEPSGQWWNRQYAADALQEDEATAYDRCLRNDHSTRMDINRLFPIAPSALASRSSSPSSPSLTTITTSNAGSPVSCNPLPHRRRPHLRPPDAQPAAKPTASANAALPPHSSPTSPVLPSSSICAVLHSADSNYEGSKSSQHSCQVEVQTMVKGTHWREGEVGGRMRAARGNQGDATETGRRDGWQDGQPNELPHVCEDAKGRRTIVLECLLQLQSSRLKLRRELLCRRLDTPRPSPTSHAPLGCIDQTLRLALELCQHEDQQDSQAKVYHISVITSLLDQLRRLSPACESWLGDADQAGHHVDTGLLLE